MCFYHKEITKLNRSKITQEFHKKEGFGCLKIKHTHKVSKKNDIESRDG